jgi:hypothetical protein
VPREGRSDHDSVRSIHRRRRRRLLVSGSVITLTLAGIAIAGPSADATTASITNSTCMSKPYELIYRIAVSAAVLPHCAGDDTSISWNRMNVQKLCQSRARVTSNNNSNPFMPAGDDVTAFSDIVTSSPALLQSTSNLLQGANTVGKGIDALYREAVWNLNDCQCSPTLNRSS